MRKGYSGAGKGFIHPAGVAGDEELVTSRNGEKRSKRNAGEQDRKLVPTSGFRVALTGSIHKASWHWSPSYPTRGAVDDHSPHGHVFTSLVHK